MQYNYFLFGWEVMLLHTSSLVACYARHSRLGVQKYYLAPKKKVILYCPQFNILLFLYRLLEEMGGITQVPRYAYDNNGMAYEAYNMWYIHIFF